MSLQIGRALGRGAGRAVSTSGVVLMVLTIAYQVVFMGSLNALVLGLLPAEAREPAGQQLGLVLPVSASVAAVLALVGFLFGTVVYLVAARALSRSPAELGSLPADLFTRRIGRATLSAIAANVVVSITVMIGFVALVVPGLFLAVSFAFVLFAVAVEDAGPIAALRRSWDLARGNRWRLLGLTLLVGVVTGLAAGLGSMLSIATPLVGQIATILISSVAGVFGIAILADAYVQVRDDSGPGGDGSAGAADAQAI